MSTNFTAESAAKHQAELNEYLQSKNINQLFIQIVESLLIEKPEKPIAFIVEFLEKKFPGECRQEIQEIEKSDVEIGRIVAILESQILFRDLDDNQRKLAAKAMSPLSATKGQSLVEQGEDGDHFFVLMSGSVDCFVGEELVKTYGPGSTFGELALMYDSKRAATCRANSACKLYALDRKSFKSIVTHTMNEKRAVAKQFLRQVDILKQLDESEMDSVADAAVEESFEKVGTVICKQGEEGGDKFYIVKQGAVSCTQTDAKGDEIEVARLKVGDYFGEIALLTPKPRQATVVVSAPDTTLLSIDRLTFNRILGSLEDTVRSRTR